MAETEGGVGGKARSKKIDQLVDQMVKGTDSKSTDRIQGPKAKVPYVPSAQEKKTRQYGAPISPPITLRDRQTTDRHNKYV
jgi:hypothetical protein